ncbi:MAG: hypothetical protein JWM80_4188 [Cyanobacteria bacterium RYN_339]|nr:hypothetical protein [Cyanobacteria bacterium RYN_339]
MKRRVASSLLLLSLAACRVTPAPAVHTVAAKSPGPAPVASKAVDAQSTKPPTAQAEALRPPADAYHTLAGVVQVDAGRLVAQGGTLLSNNGGSIAVASGGALLSNNGGGLLSDSGGSLIAGNTGNFIAKDGGREGTAVAAPGGALLASGGLISDHGGALTGKVKYQLQQTTERPPTAGMLVSAVSLKTHKYVPLGVDGAGKPVYAVYSNLKGGYELYLPKAEEGNVLVVASAPEVHDEALICNAFTPVESRTAVPIDEDVAIATRHVRRLFVGRMTDLLTGNIGQELLDRQGAHSPVLGPILARLTALLKQRATAAAIPSGPGWSQSAQVQELAQLLTDASLAFIDYDGLRVSKLYTPTWIGPDEPAYPAMADGFHLIRDTAERYIAAHSNEHPLRVRFNINPRNGAEGTLPECFSPVTLTLDSAATISTYIENDMLTGDFAHPLHNATQALRSLSLVPLADPDAQKADDPSNFLVPGTGIRAPIVDRIDACQQAVLGAILLTLSPPDWNGEAPYPPATQTLIDLLDAYCASHKFTSPPAPGPRPTCGP